MLAVPAKSVYAAARTVTVKITEDQINSYIRNNGLDRTGEVSDAHILVQEGQLAVAGTVSSPGMAPAKVAYGVVPAINNGVITWAYSVFVFNDTPISPADLGITDDPTADVNALLRVFIRQYNLRGLQPTSITLTNHTITIVYSTPGAPAPTPAAPPAAITGCTVTTNTDLNLRSTPSSNG